jgi:hypothetical protein
MQPFIAGREIVKLLEQKKQNRAFSTKSVFCCYTWDTAKRTLPGRLSARVCDGLTVENETTLYFFIDSFAGLKLSSPSACVSRGLCL